MKDYSLIFPNCVEVCSMKFPDRKKPMICIRNGARICAYGSFITEAHARDFMHLLATLINAKDETTGGDEQ